MTQTAAHIVPFPFPQREAHNCETYGEAVFQLKLKAAQLLNEVAEGIYVLTPNNIEAIRDVNRRCHEVGLPPLNFE
ncbi:hypothetical protein [Larkinella terrae]|uniref:Uncharacterized protein n=1 Tax=Larkinella terrae TaxID=2025311 RepID=A0A7K0ENR1_9BACT|nr:hypothetical protein [Larkinella terrae]MRS63108.1 hypothetical protein [Larkinella terrae]